MEIYLVRHTAPDVSRGLCYGQADIGVRSSFYEEAAVIRSHLPKNPDAVYSSPLRRCHHLAAHLYVDHSIQLYHDLKEIDCGHWELKNWDAIPHVEVSPWIADRINVQIPGGESYREVFQRVAQRFDAILNVHQPGWASGGLTDSLPAHQSVIVAHGGVLRSILAHITQTPLQEAFQLFRLYYGCVVKITRAENGLQHEFLSNIPHEPETHRPSDL